MGAVLPFVATAESARAGAVLGAAGRWALLVSESRGETMKLCCIADCELPCYKLARCRHHLAEYLLERNPFKLAAKSDNLMPSGLTEGQQASVIGAVRTLRLRSRGAV